MAVQLFDTLSRALREIPRQADRVSYYCCGPTVYGPAHIGNFRTFILQDVLRRVLEVDGCEVIHVRNITDVEDKTIAGSQRDGVSLRDFTDHWTRKFHEDCTELNLLPPVHEPRATEHIPQQIAMIERLIEKGHAYPTSEGSVYFKVTSFDHYPELANLDPDQLQTQTLNSAQRPNDADEYDRESVRDFALWKARKPEDGANAWNSPWGPGRPGWHIECSAMATEILGPTVDIHGGGVDLCFPHHTNEIAQSECSTGCRPFARHWFHTAHLLVEGAKMSKSAGNFYRLADLVNKGHTPMTVRYALLAGHYRQQLNLTDNGLAAAASALQKLERSVGKLLERCALQPEWFREHTLPSPLVSTGVFEPAWRRLTDDLNVPAALGELFSALRDLLAEPDFSRIALQGQIQALASMCYALGLRLFETPADSSDAARVPEEVLALADERWSAKKAKDFARADALRRHLLELGWTVVDRKDGFDLKANDG